MHSPDPESGAGGRPHQPSGSGYELHITVSTISSARTSLLALDSSSLPSASS
jgi:hypothetical protein